MTVGNIPSLRGVSGTKVDGIRRERGEVRAEAASSGSTDVSRSELLQFIQDLKEDAGRMPPVRADLVEQAKADIASGALGSDEDLDAAVNALLAGF